MKRTPRGREPARTLHAPRGPAHPLNSSGSYALDSALPCHPTRPRAQSPECLQRKSSRPGRACRALQAEGIKLEPASAPVHARWSLPAGDGKVIEELRDPEVERPVGGWNPGTWSVLRLRAMPLVDWLGHGEDALVNAAGAEAYRTRLLIVEDFDSDGAGRIIYGSGPSHAAAVAGKGWEETKDGHREPSVTG